MTEMFGEAWPPMSVPDLAPDDDDDDDDDVSSGLSMPLLSRVPSHLWGRIGESRRGLSSPPIPLYGYFVWPHLPE